MANTENSEVDVFLVAVTVMVLGPTLSRPISCLSLSATSPSSRPGS